MPVGIGKTFGGDDTCFELEVQELEPSSAVPIELSVASMRLDDQTVFRVIW